MVTEGLHTKMLVLLNHFVPTNLGSFGLVQEAASIPSGGRAMPTPGQPSPFSPYPDASGSGGPSFNATPPPQFPSPQRFPQTGYPLPGPLTGNTPGSHQGFRRSKRFMDPYLQFTCGPLLRYDNIDSDRVWHGAVLIVSA